MKRGRSHCSHLSRLATEPTQGGNGGQQQGQAATQSQPQASQPRAGGGGPPHYPRQPRGGGGGGGGNNGSNQNGGQPPQPGSFELTQKHVGFVAGILALVAGIYATVTDTPPRKAQSENLSHQVKIEEQKTAQVEAVVEHARIAGSTGHPPGVLKLPQVPAVSQPAEVPASKPSPAPPVAVVVVPEVKEFVAPSNGTCVSPIWGHTKFSQPLRIPAGGCISLDPVSRAAGRNPLASNMYFWARFDAVPETIVGVREMSTSYLSNKVAVDGERFIMPKERCSMHNSQLVGCNSFAEFIGKHLGEVLFVDQMPEQSLEIK